MVYLGGWWWMVDGRSQMWIEERPFLSPTRKVSYDETSCTVVTVSVKNSTSWRPLLSRWQFLLLPILPWYQRRRRRREWEKKDAGEQEPSVSFVTSLRVASMSLPIECIWSREKHRQLTHTERSKWITWWKKNRNFFPSFFLSSLFRWPVQLQFDESAIERGTIRLCLCVFASKTIFSFFTRIRLQKGKKRTFS